jgi:hypothetical protein
MGRYYSGDIEGKFWFGVQSSMVASDRFGCHESEPDHVDYYVEEDQEYLAKEGSQNGSQNRIILPKGSIRIVVTLDGYHALREAKRVDVDGRVFAIKSGGNHSGFPANQFYHFHLTPVDE